MIEELGIYDPMVRETDARAILNGERIAYWIGVGAQPSDKVKVLIKKYGKDGTIEKNPKGMLLAGRVAKGMDRGCISCHSQADGKDFLFSNDE